MGSARRENGKADPLIGAVVIGATKIAVRIVDDDGKVLACMECPTWLFPRAWKHYGNASKHSTDGKPADHRHRNRIHGARVLAYRRDREFLSALERGEPRQRLEPNLRREGRNGQRRRMRQLLENQAGVRVSRNLWRRVHPWSRGWIARLARATLRAAS